MYRFPIHSPRMGICLETRAVVDSRKLACVSTFLISDLDEAYCEPSAVDPYNNPADTESGSQGALLCCT